MTPLEAFQALIALPREAGTPSADAARRLLRGHLERLGYTVREQPVSFQPACLNVLPILGAGLGWLTLLEFPLLVRGSLWPGLAALTWFAGLTALGTLAWGIGTGVEVLGVERREDANLIATRNSLPVRRWIVAHLDTKAQGHSLAGRLVAVWFLVGAALVLTGLVVVRAVVGAPMPVASVAAAAALALGAGVLASRGRLSGTSPGARDNGTGLLAALTAAQACREDGIGFLFTGAEEFGLVGARAFAKAAEWSPAAEVVNLDTLTERGTLNLVVHNAAGRALANQVDPMLEGAAPDRRIRQLPLGILVDSVPLARAGGAAITIARLDWEDLRRMHTPRDTVEELGLFTAETVGRAITALR